MALGHGQIEPMIDFRERTGRPRRKSAEINGQAIAQQFEPVLLPGP
jgi:hypothetical protein